mgnify:CR=1 FL=1
MFNAVVISVIVLAVLCLLRVNVLLAILIAAVVAGLLEGLSIGESVTMLIAGMGGLSETALSYILLGTFAVMIGYSGITGFLVRSLLKIIRGKRAVLLLTIAGVACFSQNLVPVHIAFIPILIPPLLHLFDKLKVDRRGVACALTFGLKAPYMVIPAGYGLIFHGIIANEMTASGMEIARSSVATAMLIPGLGMVVGLLIAIFLTYRKDREMPHTENTPLHEFAASEEENLKFTLRHGLTIVAIIAALAVQIITESLVIGAFTGIALMFLFNIAPFRKGEKFVTDGITMMGMIAFIMLIASGYAHILKETGAVDALVQSTTGFLEGSSKIVVAFILLLVGLLVTMGIGTSFGTVPIITALYVPICMTVGFSPLATTVIIGTAGALGDAGSPASDSTLGPTSGLNADGKHHHIWDTVVPTFIHFNIPLLIFGTIAAIVL